MAHGNLCRHGWVPSQPLLVIVSPFYPSPLSPSSPQLSLLISPSLFLYPPTPALLAPHHLHPDTHTHTIPPPPLSLSKDLQATVPSLHPRYPSTPNTPPPTTTTLPLLTPSFSLRGCSSRCTLTARGYCVWKCSCWTRRPLQSTGQRLEHLCLRLGTFDLQRTLQTCHRS